MREDSTAMKVILIVVLSHIVVHLSGKSVTTEGDDQYVYDYELDLSIEIVEGGEHVSNFEEKVEQAADSGSLLHLH